MSDDCFKSDVTFTKQYPGSNIIATPVFLMSMAPLFDRRVKMVERMGFISTGAITEAIVTGLAAQLHSRITYDRGTEMACHVELPKLLSRFQEHVVLMEYVIFRRGNASCFVDTTLLPLEPNREAVAPYATASPHTSSCPWNRRLRFKACLGLALAIAFPWCRVARAPVCRGGTCRFTKAWRSPLRACARSSA